jgi:hypothetical protein
MMAKKKIALAGLIVGLVLIFACRKTRPESAPLTPQHTPGQGDQREFAISIYTDQQTGLCFVDFPEATLWKTKHQKVTWFSDDFDYQVDFGPHGPFGRNPIPVPFNPQGSSSGSLNADASGHYDYTIVGKSCKGAGDPVIYVK